MVNRYRIFENDIPYRGYSCWCSVMADTAVEALQKKHLTTVRCYAVSDDPESLLRYGPDSKTGKLPPDYILQRGRSYGLVAGPKRFTK
jgi:hypothetical protein